MKRRDLLRGLAALPVVVATTSIGQATTASAQASAEAGDLGDDDRDAIPF